MNGTLHVFEFLDQPLADLPVGVMPLFGNDRFLKRLAIAKLKEAFAGGDEEFSPQEFEGPETDWAAINDELLTRSLFGSDGPKMVVVDNADAFVKTHRDRLEQLHSEGFDGLLILVVDTWMSNTRLYKSIARKGLQIKCVEPKRGKSDNRDDKAVQKWMVNRAKGTYDFTLPAAGAQTVIDCADGNFGLMDQELQKLAVWAGAGGKVSAELVRETVGGWRTRTMWDALDAVADGDAGTALTLLNQLLRGGDHPLALFGQMAWSLRRYGMATEIVYQQLRASKRPRLSSAISEAGFYARGSEMDKATARLKSMGSKRSGKILDWLREADLSLKRSHSTGDRGRLVLELMIAKLSSQIAAKPAS